jgi:fructose/tagatose bisphosphate aldolase
MSTEIVDLCLEYSAVNNYPIMIIASRNQIDSQSGYVMTNKELSDKVKSNTNYNPSRVLICRDHCGPYFSDADKNLSLDDALARCKQTILGDVEAGFDLIHIDVSRSPTNTQESITQSLFDYALNLNPNLMFEYGSEDNTGENLDGGVDTIRHQIELIKNYPNVKYIVSQTGSLTRQTQVGSFDVNRNRRIADFIHSAGFLFKEHNADYIVKDEVQKRVQAGVDAINIAPQLGVIQSQILKDLGQAFTKEYTAFYNFVLEQKYWTKWITDDVSDPDVKFLVSAHYFFNSKLCKDLRQKIDESKLPFLNNLRTELFLALDEYRLGFKK